MYKNQKELDYLLELLSNISLTLGVLNTMNERATEIWDSLSPCEKQYIRNRRSELRGR